MNGYLPASDAYKFINNFKINNLYFLKENLLKRFNTKKIDQTPQNTIINNTGGDSCINGILMEPFSKFMAEHLSGLTFEPASPNYRGAFVSIPDGINDSHILEVKCSNLVNIVPELKKYPLKWIFQIYIEMYVTRRYNFVTFQGSWSDRLINNLTQDDLSKYKYIVRRYNNNFNLITKPTKIGRYDEVYGLNDYFYDHKGFDDIKSILKFHKVYTLIHNVISLYEFIFTQNITEVNYGCFVKMIKTTIPDDEKINTTPYYVRDCLNLQDC